MAWIQIIDMKDSDGELRRAYTAMMNRPIPAAYRPPHGDAPGIIRAHSLDPEIMGVAFGTSGTLHQGDALSWADRELVAADASRTNECVY